VRHLQPIKVTTGDFELWTRVGLPLWTDWSNSGQSHTRTTTDGHETRQVDTTLSAVNCQVATSKVSSSAKSMIHDRFNESYMGRTVYCCNHAQLHCVVRWSAVKTALITSSGRIVCDCGCL